MVDIQKLLEEYSLEDILELLDIPEEDVLEYLFDTGYISWEELTGKEIPLPVTLEIEGIDNGESEINDYED